jgi:hypothetical protein
VEAAFGLDWVHFEELRYDATQGFETITKGYEGYRWLGDPEIRRSIWYALGYATTFCLGAIASFLWRENYS